MAGWTLFSDASETRMARRWCCWSCHSQSNRRRGIRRRIDQDQQELIKYKDVMAPYKYRSEGKENASSVVGGRRCRGRSLAGKDVLRSPVTAQWGNHLIKPHLSLRCQRLHFRHSLLTWGIFLGALDGRALCAKLFSSFLLILFSYSYFLFSLSLSVNRPLS